MIYTNHRYRAQLEMNIHKLYHLTPEVGHPRAAPEHVKVGSYLTPTAGTFWASLGIYFVQPLRRNIHPMQKFYMDQFISGTI